MPVRSKKTKAQGAKDIYEKAEDLPEGRKKRYDSILEDFDKQIEARIEQFYSAVSAMETQIRSQFKVALLQQPRSVRCLKAEDFYYESARKENDMHNIAVECAKVAVSVTNSVTDEVKTTVKKAAKGRSKKKSSILAQAPTSVRRSTRKRAQPSWLSETPLASSTMMAAALGCTTAKTRRTKGQMVSQTPMANISSIHPMITPKFDINTPLVGTAMRTQKPEEKFLVSMNGSPVWLGGRKGKKNDNLIPLPLGNGQTLVIPADNPEVQPMIQKLIKDCMDVMNRK